MIPEKMLELLLLENFLQTHFSDKERIDGEKIKQRYVELCDEFLKPYVITEKSE